MAVGRRRGRVDGFLIAVVRTDELDLVDGQVVKSGVAGGGKEEEN